MNKPKFTLIAFAAGIMLPIAVPAWVPAEVRGRAEASGRDRAATELGPTVTEKNR